MSEWDDLYELPVDDLIIESVGAEHSVLSLRRYLRWIADYGYTEPSSDGEAPSNEWLQRILDYARGGLTNEDDDLGFALRAFGVDDRTAFPYLYRDDRITASDGYGHARAWQNKENVPKEVLVVETVRDRRRTRDMCRTMAKTAEAGGYFRQESMEEDPTPEWLDRIITYARSHLGPGEELDLEILARYGIRWQTATEVLDRMNGCEEENRNDTYGDEQK